LPTPTVLGTDTDARGSGNPDRAREQATALISDVDSVETHTREVAEPDVPVTATMLAQAVSKDRLAVGAPCSRLLRDTGCRWHRKARH
jgi:hypothetical protein